MDKRPLLYIFISATLFGISPPLAKLLLKEIHPIALAGQLYLGAFIGLSLYSIGKRVIYGDTAKIGNLRKKDLTWLCGAILSGGIAAPICLMFGLSRTSGFTASLLLNLEGIFTAVIAVVIFKENAGKRLWLALICMTVVGVFSAWDSNLGQFTFLGPLLIVLSMMCWSVDNNLTRHISTRNPIQITRIKGFTSGIVSVSLAYFLGVDIKWDLAVAFALLLGSFSYGISLVFFIKALEGLGSFRTGMFFSLAPFIGAFTSLLLLREWIGWVMLPAVMFTIAGVWLISTERHSHPHFHPEDSHAHSHDHKDMHHRHDHEESVHEPHIHEHRHHQEIHIHHHWPDAHHRHEH